MSIHDRVSSYVKIYLLELGVVHPTPFHSQYPSPNRKESAPSINTQAIGHGCHHNKLEVRPTLLETKFQVSAAKHKGGSSPQNCL